MDLWLFNIWLVGSRIDVQFIGGVLFAAGFVVLLAKGAESGIEHFWMVGAFFLGLGDVCLIVAVNGPFSWGGLIGLVASSAWAYPRSSRLMERRDLEIQEFARRSGLAFAPIQDVPMHLLDLLSGYDGLSAFRVVSGSWHETPIIAGEYRYADYSGDDLPGFGVLRFGLASMPVPAPLIVVRRHHALTRLRDRVTRKYVSFGDGAFDRRFRVTCEVPRDARVVLTARARAWLAANDRYGSYLIGGHDIVVLAPYRHDIQDVTALLDWLRQFRAILEREMTDAVG